MPHAMTKYSHKKFVYMFIALMLVAITSIMLMLLTAYNRGDLIAPPLTGSISFDEKLYYIARAKKVDKIDVLAVGSSMTFNNLSSSQVAKELGNKFLNFASWGLTIQQSSYLIKFLVPIYKPQVVIIVSSPMDFYRSYRKSAFFDKDEVKQYLLNPEILQAYNRHFDPRYILKSSWGIKDQRKSNHIYESLLFDPYGGVLLDIDQASINKERWETRIDPAKLDPVSYEALEDLALFLKQQDIAFIMVQPPMRQAAVDGLSPQLANHWQKISAISSKTGLTFINMHEKLGFTDNLFVDHAHLNQKGAEIFTQKFLEIASPSILAKRLH